MRVQPLEKKNIQTFYLINLPVDNENKQALPGCETAHQLIF